MTLHLTRELPQAVTFASAWRAVQVALGATVVVHLLRTAFALSLAHPVSLVVKGAPWQASLGPEVAAANGALWLLESFRIGWQTLTGQALLCIGVAVLYLLLVPLLSMFWLCALARPRSLHNSITEAARRYHASLVVSALCAAAFVAATAATLGFPWMAYEALAFVRDQRARDLLALPTAIPGLVLLWTVATWHDTSRVALATADRRPLGALRLGLRVALRYRVLTAFAGWLGCGMVLTAAGSITAALLAAAIPTGAAPLSMLLLQTCALGRTLLRARWLASAIQKATR